MSTPQKFMRLPAVMDTTGVSRSTLLRWVKAGTFPAPVNLGARAVAWDSTEVAMWQAARLATRVGSAAG